MEENKQDNQLGDQENQENNNNNQQENQQQQQQQKQNLEEKDEELPGFVDTTPDGLIPCKFRYCQLEYIKSMNTYDQKLKEKKQVDKIKTQPKDKRDLQGLVFFGNLTQYEERVCSEEILYSGTYTFSFKICVPPLKREIQEPSPAFFVGLVEDGKEDSRSFGEKYIFKRIFGANSKTADNKGMLGKIDGEFEYGYDLEQDLKSGEENEINLLIDFDKNIFRVKTKNKKNIYQHMSNFVKLNTKEWRIYFGWVGSRAKLTIGELTRKKSKILPKDKYGRIIKPSQQ